jgi:type IV pilus assembly protein PilF
MIAGVLLAAAAGCTSVGATRSAQDVSDKNPAEVNAQLGIEYMRKGMNEAAMDTLTKAVRQNPDLQLAQVSLAILFERLGENEDAERHYRRAYELNRKDPVTLNAYGQFLCRKGELEKADDLFVVAAKDPLYQHPELIFTNAGICALKKPDLQQAETYFRKALQRNPKYQPALSEMARLSFQNQQYLAARAYLQRLQELEPLPPEFLWLGIQVENELGNRDAVSSYSLVIKNQYPESDEVQLLIEWERASGER